ncbi:MAG: gamma-glutamyltransferase family protein, partial [Chloroflexia bacterium]|nr:gamma-glutamyltransferase family protein [Chloroflexia bacterium]
MIGFPSTTNDADNARWERRRAAPVFANRGMVASAHPLTVAAGLHTLEQGGNAVDAAISAALTAGVVMPEMCGIGGDLFAIVHAPARPGQTTGETLSFLGSGIAPRGASLDHMRAHGDPDGRGGLRMPYRGSLAPGVPGMIDAAFAMLDRFGSKPFAELIEPAVTHSADGFPLTPLGAGHITSSADLLRQYPTSAAVFLAGGDAPSPGDILKQPALARSLRRIAEGGRAVFYEGEIAAEITRFLAETGGAMSRDDLASHATAVEAPLATTYRGHTVYQTGLPTQGLILLESLNLAELVSPGTLGAWGPDSVHLLAEAAKIAYADRNGHSGDPAFVDTPLSQLLSKEWAAQRFETIAAGSAAEDVPAGALQDGDTTYISVVDSDGMMVSLIISVSANFGCGVVAGETGIILNNRVGRGFTLEDGHPNQYSPGKKTMHTLNCFSVADTDGRPVLVGGTPGGDGQPQWNLQTLVGLIDGGLDVQAAIELPRWTVWPGTDPLTLPNPYELRVENRLSEAALEDLASRGHRVRSVDAWGGGGASQ